MAILRPGPNNNGIRGRMGGQVYTEDGADTIVREFVSPSNPKTKAQLQARERMSYSTQAWGSLTDEERGTWTNYAELVYTHSPRRTRQRNLSAFQAFAKLNAKYSQVAGALTFNANAPESKFLGDKIQITVTPGSGKVTLTASAANAADVTTEILVQKVKATYIKPKENGYKHKVFNQFTSGAGLTMDLTLGTGAWAIAVRFVKTTTGEQTALQELGNSQVLLMQAGKDSGRKAA